MEIDFSLISHGTISDIKKHLKEVLDSVPKSEEESVKNLIENCKSTIDVGKEFNICHNNETKSQSIINDFNTSMQCLCNDISESHYRETGRRIDFSRDGIMFPSELINSFIMTSTIFEFFRDLRFDSDLYTDFLQNVSGIDQNLVYFKIKTNSVYGIESDIYDDCWLHAIKALIYGCRDYDWVYDRFSIYFRALYDECPSYREFVDDNDCSIDEILTCLKIFLVSRELNDLYIDNDKGSHCIQDECFSRKDQLAVLGPNTFNRNIDKQYLLKYKYSWI